MNKIYNFPFGQKLERIEQKDRTPKKAFVLGVYASAVHANWIDVNGKSKVTALAIASEPEIFWNGDNASNIISKVKIPKELGKLVAPTNKNLNGASGLALDNFFLTPLGLERANTWLCDLLPESRVNENQRKAIDKHYTEDIINQYGLTQANIPNFDKSDLDSFERRNEILSELKQSEADTIILLGDLPIKNFLSHHESKYKKLSDFGETDKTYGKLNKIKIDNKEYNLIALCHPRQASRLGKSNKKWGKLHDNWYQTLMKKKIKNLFAFGSGYINLGLILAEQSKVYFEDLNFGISAQNNFLKLSYIDDTLIFQKKLKILILNNNQLTSLPENFHLLSELEELYLLNNNINFLPENFGYLPKLKVLLLTNNQIKSLPKSFKYLESLENLSIKGNPLDNNTKKQLPNLLPNCSVSF